MTDRPLDRVARAVGQSSSRRQALRVAGGGIAAALGALRGLTNQESAEAACSRPQADPCSCVVYVRSRTGLCGGLLYAYQYTETEMWNRGYKRVTPRAGAIMVWDRGAKCASRTAGHMSICRSATYNSTTKKWVIYVDDANWGGCGIRLNRLTSTCADWGNLWGVNFYVPR
jgi:hypothetical protein